MYGSQRGDMVTDVTARRSMERDDTGESTGESFDSSRLVLETLNDAVFVLDSRERVQYLNPAAGRLAGVDRGAARDARFHRLVRLLDGMSGSRLRGSDLLEAGAGKPRPPHSPHFVRRDDGTRLAVDVSAMVLPARSTLDGSDTELLVVIRDASDAYEQWKRVLHQATHDGLTGLVNRVEFERRLTNVLKHLSGNGSHALLYMDLDRFKLVNDSCGHAAGDELLQVIARLFLGRVRERDTLARLGGDEFALLMEHCPLSKAIETATVLTNALDALCFRWDDRLFRVSVSIGVVPVPGTPIDARRMLAFADAACYTAKRNGRVHVASGAATSDEAPAGTVNNRNARPFWWSSGEVVRLN